MLGHNYFVSLHCDSNIYLIMASTEFRLSAKKDVNGRSQIIVKLTIDRTHRPCFKSGVYVSPDWFKPVQETKKGNVYGIKIPNKGRLNVLEVKDANEAKVKLDSYVSRLTKICNEYMESKQIPTHDELEEAMILMADVPEKKITLDAITEAREAVQRREANGGVDTASFFGTMEYYLRSGGFSEGKIKGFRVVMRMLARYQSFVRETDKERKDFTLNIETLDKETLEDFFDYAKNERALSEEYPTIFKKLLSDYPVEIIQKRKSPHLVDRGNNTLFMLKRKLKAFYNWLNKRGITDNMPFKGIEIGQERYGTPYYLTLEERNLIADYDFKDRKELGVQRDIFIFQCLIGCRVSDLLKLKESNIIDDGVEYIPKKTKGENPETVRVPLNSRAKALVEKYRGVDKKGRLFPFISSQKYNEHIKEILTKCEVKRMVTVRNPMTGEDEQKPINEIASSHMARRTFIGNLYRQLKDPNLIGKLSGHVEGSTAFARYRDIDEDVKKEVVSLID